jgi:magnesium transporter
MMAFLPLVLASGGNSGSQSATLIIRALAVEELRKKEKLDLARREFLISILLGTCLALLGFVAVFVVFGMELAIACVVALTVFLVVVLGTVAGGLLPLVFQRLGMDPALMSNPLIAALVDVLGVVIYIGVAWLALDA